MSLLKHIGAADALQSGVVGTGGSMPSDLQSQSLIRLKALIVGLGLISLLGLGLNTGGPTWWGWNHSCADFGKLVHGTLLILSLGFLLLLKRQVLAPTRLLDLALLYEVVVAFTIAYSEQAQPTVGVSLVAIIILIFPLFVPTSYTKTLLAAFAAASMGPLSAAIYTWAGGKMDHPFATLAVSYGFNFLVALLATVPAHIVSGMARTLKRARRLGSYELGEKLGAGGMGEVWRATHRMLRRPAAIKLIRPEALRSRDGTPVPAVMERFEREAQATAMLESPHTVQLYDYGVTDDGTLFHVMELLRGINFETLVEEYGPQPPERVVHLLRQVCDSLDDAHQSGLVHRDIKPANLFLAHTRRTADFVKVLDFGLVKQLGKRDQEEPGISLTQEDLVQGTPAYLSPEAITGEQVLDGRADLYGLGCVAYWLLTGEMVFSAETPMNMAIAHATAEPAPPSERVSTPIPPELEQIVMACLSKNRDERPASARQLSAQLDDLSFDQAWNERQADQWWSKHLPEIIPWCCEEPDKLAACEAAGMVQPQLAAAS